MPTKSTFKKRRLARSLGTDSAASRMQRKAIAVDPDIKTGNLNRLKRIEGQVRGLQKMVEENRYCAEILNQLASVQEALRGVGRELLRNHLCHCVAHATKTGGHKAQEAYDELIELFYKNAR